jgi:PKD repeat protein
MIKKIIPFLFFLVGLSTAYSQFTINPNGAISPQQAVQDVLVGFGIQAFNVTYNGSAANAQNVSPSVFQFDYTGANFPLQSGILMQTQGAPSVFNDADLLSLSGQPVTNGVIIEFDFIPTGDTLSFRYHFASSEYTSYTCSNFNDVFGFFISGPGINGPFSNNAVNLAVVPGTNIPVAINTVNSGSAGFNSPATCAAADPNWQANSIYFTTSYNPLFTANTQIVDFNGATITLSANTDLVCNQVYHIKLAIANAVDQALDSGVFLEAGSFASDAVAVTVATVSGDTTIVEGCTDANFIFTRPSTDTADTLLINYTITGDAVEGTDFNFLPDTIIFLPGQDSVIINLIPTQDGVTEGFESVIITVELINPCNDTIFSQGTIFIGEGPIINITENDPILQCATDSIPLFVSASGGYAPYVYEWTDIGGSPAGTGDTIFGAISQNGTISYLVTATDFCNFSNTDTVTITMNQTLAIDTMGTVPSSCQPTGVVWGLATGTTGIPAYNWTGPGSNSTNFINASVWEDIPSGWYYFTVTDLVCSVNDSVFVELLDPPVASFSVTPLSGCSPLEVTITNSSQNGTAYLWNLGDGTTNTTTDLTGFTHTFTDSLMNQAYTIQLIVQQGQFCSDTAVVGVVTSVCGCTNLEADNYNPNATVDDGSCIFPDPIINAPNVLTPDGDGINDIFDLDWLNLNSLRLVILNRWGNVIYDETSDNLLLSVPSWDGGTSEDGVYFYRYEGTGIAGQELDGHGFLHLIRNN